MGTASPQRALPAPRPTTAVLLRAAHPGPTMAVTAVAALLCRPAGTDRRRAVVVVGAVLTGQLSIGWSNDLVDAARDRSVGRADKPLATGDLDQGHVRAACAGATAATVGLTLATGPAAPLHGIVVASGWAYNLWAKSSAWSWLPYATAFGALPAFVWRAAPTRLPGGWVAASGALLGVGAHLLNAVPDLDEDAATGVRGLPHRLGATRARWSAAALLGSASLLGVRCGSLRPAARRPAAAGVLALAAAAGAAPGRNGFRAAVALALTDVLVLVVTT